MNTVLNRLWIACVSLILLLAGCSGEADVYFAVQNNPGSMDVPSVMVTFREGAKIHRINLDSSNRSAGPFSTGTSGNLDITCTVLSVHSDSKSSGSITLPLKDDWEWGVNFYISVDDPSENCFGCYGSESFMLDPALGFEQDKKLFIVWGGNSISHPVLY